MTIAADAEWWVVEPEASGTWSRLAAWWLRRRSERVWVLIAVLWGLNTLDLACTLFADRYLLLGIYAEANPIAAAVMGAGPGAVIVFKLLLVGVGTGGLAMLRRQRVAELAALAMTVAYGFVLLRWKLYFDLAEVQELMLRLCNDGDGPPIWLRSTF
ncbi:MAG: hypothetical protein JXB13_16830 [Phycisphaerae bacterium]|nr:hypothetical protein [Phycisphaerae bacterium]